MGREKKRVLILLSSYNGEKYIEQQLNSILGQTGSFELDLLIRDDGSKDSTVEILDRFVRENPKTVQLIKGENKGVNYSFFELINNADHHDYYFFSDQDDVWLPNKVKEAVLCLEKAEDKQIPLLYASTSFLVKNDLIPYGQTRRKQRPFSIYNTLIQNICPGHTQAFNNELLVLLKKNWNMDRIYIYDSWAANYAELYGRILFDNSSHTLYRQHQTNEFGSGAGFIGHLLSSRQKITKNQGSSYREQIKYFYEENIEKLRQIGAAEEIGRFLNASGFIDRVRYCFHSKLYRQSKIESFGFRVAVILGKF